MRVLWKMADVDIDPFSNHDRTDSHPDETVENIPFNPSITKPFGTHTLHQGGGG